jgi:hypothetical protein
VAQSNTVSCPLLGATSRTRKGMWESFVGMGEGDKPTRGARRREELAGW